MKYRQVQNEKPYKYRWNNGIFLTGVFDPRFFVHGMNS